MSQASPIPNLPAAAFPPADATYPPEAKEGHQSTNNQSINNQSTNNQSTNQPITSHPILLFDGICNLCNASVQWILKRDQQGQFRFAALQSEVGQQLLQKHGLSAEDFETAVLVIGEQVFLRSDAALEIVRRLGGLWRLLYFFKILPRPLRNAVYNLVARNRYRWFGHREECMLPEPAWKERFL